MEEHKILLIEHDRIRAYHGGTFTEPGSADLRKLPSGAIVPLSMLHIHTLKFPDHLSDDELRIQVEIRMFEEGNLNIDEEYTIDFIRHEITDETSVLVEVFAFSESKAAEYFAEPLNQCGAIDTVVPSFLVYSCLYPDLPPKNDLFIYSGEEEAFAAIYQNGHYIAHRTIETLTTIAVETGLDLPKLKTFLHTKGLIEENYLPEELNKYILLQNRVAKNIERIVHTINHKRGLFGLHGIDTLYIDFEGRDVPGLAEAFEAYGIHDLSVVTLTRPNIPKELIHDTLCAEYFKHPTPFNLSPFPRKEPWYRRESGKFLGLLGGALLLVAGMSAASAWMISQEHSRNEEFSARLQTLQAQTTTLSATLKQERSRLDEEQNKSAALSEEIALYRGSKETAELIRDMHAKREQFLTDTTSELGRYRLGALLMEQNGSKQMQIQVVADYRKRDDIAKFMDHLYERGYQNARTDEIRLDDGRYSSLIKVTR